MRGKRYETEKKIWGGDRGNQYTKEASRQNDDLAKPPKTRVLLADEYGVGTATIERNARFAKVVDILPEGIKQEVLSGKENIIRIDTDAIARMDKPTQKKFLKEIESGTPIKEAVKNTWL
ncbi:MAG: hypothetical protein VB122_07610 [Erysipelotrichales bacterium]|nr:hypothetical protein [Erysipelotrichales bacterium]